MHTKLIRNNFSWYVLHLRRNRHIESSYARARVKIYKTQNRYMYYLVIITAKKIIYNIYFCLCILNRF